MIHVATLLPRPRPADLIVQLLAAAHRGAFGDFVRSGGNDATAGEDCEALVRARPLPSQNVRGLGRQGPGFARPPVTLWHASDFARRLRRLRSEAPVELRRGQLRAGAVMNLAIAYALGFATPFGLLWLASIHVRNAAKKRRN
jgi:hypothetical protein